MITKIANVIRIAFVGSTLVNFAPSQPPTSAPGIICKAVSSAFMPSPFTWFNEKSLKLAPTKAVTNMIAEEVPMAFFIGSLQSELSRGTCINPPPIPSNPAIVPVIPPVVAHLAMECERSSAEMFGSAPSSLFVLQSEDN